MNNPFVAVLMGSDSDLATVQHTLDILDRLGVTWQVKITSAHRTPSETRAFIATAEQQGCEVFIAAAGLAAHLAGTVAAQALKPVIGIPMDGGPLNGHDALLSTVQMPGGIPVACVAIGRAGARNAAYLAAQILALGNPELAQRLAQERASNAETVIEKDRALAEQLNSTRT